MKEKVKVEKDHVRIKSLANKYSCSIQYVRLVLVGDASQASVKAQKILRDAQDIVDIIKRDTKVTL